MTKANYKLAINSYSDDWENLELETGAESNEMEFHEATSIFPEMGEAEFEELKQDIKKNGLRLPILAFRNRIIDGRQRLRACEQLGIAPRYQQVLHIEEPVSEYIVSMNLKRRHLSDSQRAMVANNLAMLGKGANQHTAPAVTQAKAAKLLSVSVDSIQRARQVEQNGVPSLIKAVETGDLDVTNASIISTLSPEEQAEVLKLNNKEILAQAKEIRKNAMESRRQERIAAIQDKRSKNMPLIAPDGAYSVIYADPAWDYISEQTLGYPTMPLESIKALPVDQIAAKDAVLFLWCSASLIANALKVIEAWGFNYKTHAIWDKQKGGQGVYFMVRHELLLIATRGVMPEVPYVARPQSVFCAYTGEPSEKPKEMRSVIDRMYPELPKIELFCRGEPAEGWAGWGNECVERMEDQPLNEKVKLPSTKLKVSTVKVKGKLKAANDEPKSKLVEMELKAA